MLTTIPIQSTMRTKILDLMCLTVLVYDYNEVFKLESMNKFINNPEAERCQNALNNLSGFQKDALLRLSENSPHGKVTKFIDDKTSDLQAGVTISEANERITVAFRGSESLSDWLHDLRFLKYNLKDDIYVHRGFHQQLHTNDVYEELVNEIKILLKKHPTYEIFICGHSLGGALSTLFGFELSNTIENLVTVVSFASPRVGNYAWKTAFDKKINLKHIRVANAKDIVTAAPMFRFHHTGTAVKLYDDKIIVNKDYSYNKWWEYSLFRCYSVGEHSCELYYNRLKNNTEIEEI